MPTISRSQPTAWKFRPEVPWCGPKGWRVCGMRVSGSHSSGLPGTARSLGVRQDMRLALAL
jgi:hypothetical protein